MPSHNFRTTAELAAELGDPDLGVIDASWHLPNTARIGAAEFRLKHIPGAVFFDIDAIGLTNLVARLNRGLDPGGNAIGEPTSFVVGVGVNPGAPDFENELRRFYWKVEAGAEYAITQPVFDIRQLFHFLDRIEREGIRIPVVAGIWPLVSARRWR